MVMSNREEEGKEGLTSSELNFLYLRYQTLLIYADTPICKYKHQLSENMQMIKLVWFYKEGAILT